MAFSFLAKPDPETRSLFRPRAVLREELGLFRSRFVERKVRVSSEIPARLPAALPIAAAPTGRLIRTFLSFAAEEMGLHALSIGADWRCDEGEAGTGAFRLDLVLEGDFEPEADGVLRRGLAEDCRALGAALAVEKESPERMRCAVVFPVVHREGSHPAAALASALPILSEKGGGGHDGSFALRHPFRVLAVDDSEIGLKLTMRLLRNLGYEPDQASSGAQAVRMAAARPAGSAYELIFMDLRMPDMDGREAMIEIRGLPNGGNPKVVALTAEISELERRRCLDAGMSDFLTKPCRADELAETIHHLSLAREGPPPKLAVLPTADPRWEAAAVLDAATVAPLRILPGTTKPTLLEELYESLRRDTPETFRAAARALQGSDLAELRHHVHQLTGNFEVVGARRMALLCRACSDAARREEFGELKFLFERFDSNYAALRVQLEAAIAEGR